MLNVPKRLVLIGWYIVIYNQLLIYLFILFSIYFKLARSVVTNELTFTIQESDDNRYVTDPDSVVCLNKTKNYWICSGLRV